MKTIYVRWRKQIKPEEKIGENFLIAELVEAYEEYEPRKEIVIKHLGKIEERFLTTRARDARAFHQAIFWVNADRELDVLGLPPEVRKKVEIALAEKVPRPHDNWALQGITCAIRYDPK